MRPPRRAEDRGGTECVDKLIREDVGLLDVLSVASDV